MKFNKWMFALVTSLVFIGCAEDDPLGQVDIAETAQQVGDVMASVDESGGNSAGTMATLENHRRFVALKEKQLPRNIVQDVFDLFTPITKAQAAACSTTTFSSCSSGAMVRDLNSCTIGSAVFSGNITLNFSQMACTLNADGDSVTRNPSFTVTGRRNALLTVTKVGAHGQRMTRTSSGNYTLTNDGVRRVFSASGTTLFDYTTTTASAITVTGTSRADRVMNDGSLQVVNNKSAVVCTFAPTNVAWSSSCNCASSGTWAGSCSDGKTGSIEITGCGRAKITLGDNDDDVSFDRCYSN